MNGTSWGDGFYVIWYYSWDNLQQTELVKNVTVYLDDTGPATSIDIGQPNWTAGAGGRINITSETPLQILSYESEGSIPNASTIMYRITFTDQGVNSGWRTGYAFDIGGEFYQGDGNYTIEFGSQDNLGNMQNVRMIHLYVDDSPPSLNLTLGVPKFRIYTSDAYNITDATLINFTFIHAVAYILGPEAAYNVASAGNGFGAFCGVADGYGRNAKKTALFLDCAAIR